MNLTIEMIWNVFKKEKIEKEFLFYLDGNDWTAIKISKDETEQYGSLDLDYLSELSAVLNGKSVYIVHNHIKDDPRPSFYDFFQYKYLHALFSLMGIELRDYMIVSPYGYYSFLEKNEINVLPIHQKFSSYTTEHSFTIVNHNFLLCYKEDILKRLQTNNELIFSHHLHFQSEVGFSGKDLLNISRALENECIFVCNTPQSPDGFKRIQSIVEILNPIELYIVQQDKWIPFKKTGISSMLL